MKTAQNVTLIAFCIAAIVSLAWPPALAWFAIVVLGGWLSFAAGAACAVLLGMVAG